MLKEHKLVKSGGAWYTLTDQNGKDHKFLSKGLGRVGLPVMMS